jgi:hypothetical protein
MNAVKLCSKWARINGQEQKVDLMNLSPNRIEISTSVAGDPTGAALQGDLILTETEQPVKQNDNAPMSWVLPN